MIHISVTKMVSQLAEINDKLVNERINNHHDQRLVRTGRLYFPKFNGEEVEGWIIRCNHFFAVDRTTNNAKVPYAVINLEGATLE